jgi:hypothetical protein
MRPSVVRVQLFAGASICRDSVTNSRSTSRAAATNVVFAER